MTAMKAIAVLGAGKIGSMIASFLAHTPDYQVTLMDQSQDALTRVAQQQPDITTLQVNAVDQTDLSEAFKGKYAVLNSCPFDLTGPVAQAALAAGIHYFDLTEDVASTRIVKKLAKNSATAFMPQCGLAPGFISIVAYDLARHFDKLHNVHMRVGALPKYPSNALKYNLTWSTDGLINEYLNSCEAIVNGELHEVPPLEELEEFSLDGMTYEAFNTSGGLGTLCNTLKGKVDNLNYRTVRYPGHRDVIKLLLNDLRLGENRPLLKQLLENAIPITMQDVVLVFVTVSGLKQGQFVQESFARKIYSRQIDDQIRSAIQITTASGICAVLDLMAEGKIPNHGFVRQEDVRLADFIRNRFGSNYAHEVDGTRSLDSQWAG